MLGNSIKKSESDIANIVKKNHDFMRKTKNYLKKHPNELEKLHLEFPQDS